MDVAVLNEPSSLIDGQASAVWQMEESTSSKKRKMSSKTTTTMMSTTTTTSTTFDQPTDDTYSELDEDLDYLNDNDDDDECDQDLNESTRLVEPESYNDNNNNNNNEEEGGDVCADGKNGMITSSSSSSSCEWENDEKQQQQNHYQDEPVDSQYYAVPAAAAVWHINKLKSAYDRLDFFITSQAEKMHQFLCEIRSERDELDKLELKLPGATRNHRTKSENSPAAADMSSSTTKPCWSESKTEINGFDNTQYAYKTCSDIQQPSSQRGGVDVFQNVINQSEVYSSKSSMITHQRHPLSDIRHSKVWQYFEKIENDRNVQCLVRTNGITCNKVLKYHRNTTVMLRHIKAFHKEIRLGNTVDNANNLGLEASSNNMSGMNGGGGETIHTHLDEDNDENEYENESGDQTTEADQQSNDNNNQKEACSSLTTTTRQFSVDFSHTTNISSSNSNSFLENNRHSNTSIVWKYFEKIDNNMNIQCKVVQNGAQCNKRLRFHKNTTSMLNHLRSFHKHLTIDYPPLSAIIQDNRSATNSSHVGCYSVTGDDTNGNNNETSSREDESEELDGYLENELSENMINNIVAEPPPPPPPPLMLLPPPPPSPSLASNVELVESASIADFRQSKVWKYFEKMGNESSVVCKVLFNGIQCNQTLAYDSRNTSTMLQHLKQAHKHLNMDEPMQAPPNSKPKVLIQKDVECSGGQSLLDTDVSNFFKVQINNLSPIKFYASKLNKRSANGTQMFYFDCSQNRSHLKCPCKMYVIYNYLTSTGTIYRSLELHNHD